MNFSEVVATVKSNVTTYTNAVRTVWDKSDRVFKICIGLFLVLGMYELITMSLGLLISIVYVVILFYIEGQKQVIVEQAEVINSYENAINEHNDRVSQTN